MARKYTDSELLQFIELYFNGNSHQTLVNNYNLKLSYTPFRNYVKKYEHHGIEGIRSQKKNRRYTNKFKLNIISEHLDKGYGSAYLANKYNIPSETTVNNWINRYTEGKENKDYSPTSGVYNIVNAKKSYEEKIKIVEDYIDNKRTYKEAAEKHQVSYNNIYSWVNKYKKYGPKGLEDNRGRSKPSELQTKEEHLNAEVEALKARNKWLEMENDVLKKHRKITGSLKSQELDKKRNI